MGDKGEGRGQKSQKMGHIIYGQLLEIGSQKHIECNSPINNIDFSLFLATIVLAGINDVDGIIVGGVLGHTICTGLAVIAGALISRKISVRAVTFIGAIGKAFSK